MKNSDGFKLSQLSSFAKKKLFMEPNKVQSTELVLYIGHLATASHPVGDIAQWADHLLVTQRILSSKSGDIWSIPYHSMFKIKNY